jgi:hypothetical protein
VFDGFRDENAAIEYVNFVSRHGSADIVLAAVESALPVLGADYQRAFLTSAAAAMLRDGRHADAQRLIERVLDVGGDAAVGRAVVNALAQQFGQPGLNALTGGSPVTAPATGG